MKIEKGQVYVIDYINNDGTSERTYFRADGLIWNGLPFTKEFSIDV